MYQDDYESTPAMDSMTTMPVIHSSLCVSMHTQVALSRKPPHIQSAHRVSGHQHGLSECSICYLCLTNIALVDYAFPPCVGYFAYM